MQSPFDSPLSGFRSPFAYGRRLGFSVAALFANGEQGVAFEPDPDTCFTDTAGTTPAGVGDAVALMLDKSQGVGYKDGEFTGLGPELVEDGGFDLGTVPDGFVTQNANNDLFVNSNGQLEARPGTGGYVWVGYILTVDRPTTFVYSWESTSFANVVVRTGSVAGTNTNGSSVATSLPSSGTELIHLPSSGTYNFSFGNSNGGTIDNISVRELPGNHATQPTAAARPILARVPEGGRRNVLTRTEEFDAGVWEKRGLTLSSGGVAPNGGTATVITETAVDDQHQLFQGIPAFSGIRTFSFSAYAKKKERRYASIKVFSKPGGSSSRYGFLVDLDDGTVVDTELSTDGAPLLNITSSGAEDVRNGWYRLYATCTNCENTTSMSIQMNDDATPDWGSSANIEYQGDGTSGIYIWGAQIEEGSTATSYQRVGSTYDVTETGKADKWHLVFDGVDDFLVAGTNADWKYLHDGTGCEWLVGLRPNEVSDPDTLGNVFSTGSFATSGVGTHFAIEDRSGIDGPRNNAWRYNTNSGVGGRGLFSNVISDTISNLTNQYVVRGGHKAGNTPEYFMYDNEVLEYSGSYEYTPPSTENSYGPLTIGARATDNNFNWRGKLFSLIIRGKQLTTQERADASNFVAGKTGVTL